jgi:hypothetical protein
MSEPTPPTFHANFVQVHGNAFDVALDFSYRANPDDEQLPPLLRLTMSWEHLLAMIPVLEESVASYEEQIGELPPVREAIAKRGKPEVRR